MKPFAVCSSRSVPRLRAGMPPLRRPARLTFERENGVANSASRVAPRRIAHRAGKAAVRPVNSTRHQSRRRLRMAASKTTSKSTRQIAAPDGTRANPGGPPRQRHAQAHAAAARRKRRARTGGKSPRRWSHQVMETSDASGPPTGHLQDTATPTRSRQSLETVVDEKAAAAKAHRFNRRCRCSTSTSTGRAETCQKLAAQRWSKPSASCAKRLDAPQSAFVRVHSPFAACHARSDASCALPCLMCA